MLACDHVLRMRRALVVLFLLLVAAPAEAQSVDRSDRESAVDALERVDAVIDDRGAGDQRALTPALAELARRKDDLGAADRRRARALLARPADGGTGVGRWTAPAGSQVSDCTTHFCFHWIDDETSSDAPPLIDGDDENTRPDYIDLLAEAFEQSYDTEVGSMGWLAPVSDGTLGGEDGLVDVYLSDIGPTAYGYAVPETDARSTYAYLVVDNDYDASQFPRYGGDPTIPVQATAAHEFNHVLQYGYDSYQDLWMFEATATWAEDKVFDAANDYVSYLGTWASLPFEPITSAGDGSPANDRLKMYGSAIWNHWLDQRFGEDIVRQAWARSQASSPPGIGFAPGAYDRVIRDAGGAGFASEFAAFAASTAEWGAANSEISEGTTFLPREVRREGELAIGATTPANATLDHTAFALYSVPPTNAAELHLTGGLPAGTAGSIALVGLAGGNQTRVVGLLDADGGVTVTLPDPGRFSRITAVVTNTDITYSGFDGSDWLWRKDAQHYSLTATTGAAPVTPTPTPTATASPIPTATPTATPTPTPTPATSLRLARSTTKIRSAARTGRLALFARTNKAGRLRAKATVDARTARRVRMGRRTTSIGTGRRTALAPSRLKVKVKLTRKARAALRKHKKRTVRIKVRVTFVPDDGSGRVRRTILIRLRR